MGDRVDAWLVQNYPPMTLAERFEIREAVASGGLVRDPALKAAACGLAFALLNGQLRDRDTPLLATAAVTAIAGTVSVSINASIGGGVMLDTVMGAFWLAVTVIVLLRYITTPSRDKIKRALRLNGSDPSANELPDSNTSPA